MKLSTAKWIFLVFASALFFVSCSKEDKKRSTPAAFSYQNGQCINNSSGHSVDRDRCSEVAAYYLSDGNCFKRSSGAVVNRSLCDNYNEYYSSNGSCYSSSTNSEVNVSLCQVDNGVGSSNCRDMHYYQDGFGQWQQVNCSQQNCSGSMLYDYNGNIVTCN